MTGTANERETRARRATMYDSPAMKAARAERDREPGPADDLLRRHADEKSAMQNRHATEGKNLRDRHAIDRGARLRTSEPMPAGYDERQKREHSQLEVKHDKQRKELRDRHLVERDEQRRRSAKT